jgi:hypothetical protein
LVAAVATHRSQYFAGEARLISPFCCLIRWKSVAVNYQRSTGALNGSACPARRAATSRRHVLKLAGLFVEGLLAKLRLTAVDDFLDRLHLNRG